MNMRNAFDFTPYRRSTVGFDRLFDLLENGAAWQGSDNYPPFDLERTGDDSYRITLAVAGFAPEEIDVTAQQNLLIVTGRKQAEEEGRYIHRGIATRAFERRFGLADFVEVRSAELKDGILSVEIVREIPEAMKPRKIAIGGAAPAQVADQSAGNDNAGESQAA
jgi:molecular chaperone IbpA